MNLDICKLYSQFVHAQNLKLHFIQVVGIHRHNNVYLSAYGRLVLIINEDSNNTYYDNIIIIRQSYLEGRKIELQNK